MKLRVVICSNDDLTSNLIFSRLLSEPNLEILLISITSSPDSKHRKGNISGAFALLKKVYWRYWLFLVVINGFYKLHESISHVLKRQEYSYLIRPLAIKQGIEINSVANFNDHEYIKKISSLKPDLILIRINQIVSKDFLAIPKIGTYCIHSSLLPSFKGIAAEFHTMKLEQVNFGSSIFEVTPRLDEGQSVAQIDFISKPINSLFFNMVANNFHAGELLIKWLSEVAAGSKIKYLKPHLKPSYFSWPRYSDFSVFRQKRKVIIYPLEFLRLILFLLKKPSHKTSIRIRH